MTYENFLKVILKQQLLDRQIDEAYKLKIDLIDFVDGYHEIITTLIKEIYGSEGYDWYSWFCYESDYGHKGIEAWDVDGKPICYSFESLYEYLENNYKTKPMKNTNPTEPFISLYDFQGHRDINGVGASLFTYAKHQGIIPQTRNIENPKYQGIVMLYPRFIIEDFFKQK